MKTRLLIFSLFILAFIGVFPHDAGAVTVGPVRIEYSVNPGDTINGDIFLFNEGTSQQVFWPSFEKFNENENGEKVFSKEASGLSTWFEVPSSVTLNANEQRHIPFVLTIPKNAEPGGHFAVMWWGTSPPSGTNEGQVSIVTRAGILVYLRVSGDIKEEANISSFSTKRFFTKPPINFSMKFKNTGNVAVTPKGKIAVLNLFGMEKVTIPFNPNGAIALPKTEKAIDTQWNFGDWFFGPYRAEARILYGDSNKEVEASRWIFVFAWKPLLCFLLFVFLIFVLPPALRGYNRWIIEKAKQK